MHQRLLSGEQEYVEPGSDLGDEIKHLRQDFELMQKAMTQLRQQMNVMQRGLGVAAGEIPATGVDDAADKWETIKQRLPPRQQEAIDVLLLQGSMKRVQLAAALKMNYTNCATNVIAVLIRSGWMVDNGGSLSLKPL